MIGHLATGLGLLIRWVAILVNYALTVAGPLLVVYGIDLIYRPAAFIVTGLLVTAFMFRRPRVANGVSS